MSHTTVLLLALCIALFVMMTSAKETYAQDFAKVGSTNFPGGDITSQSVKKTSECRDACEDNDECAAFTVTKKSNKKNKTLTCWLKSKDVLAGENRTPDNTKDTYVLKTVWETLKSQTTGNDASGKVCYGYVSGFMNPNHEGDVYPYKCGRTLVPPAIGSFKIPPGLRLKFISKTGEESGWYSKDLLNLDGWEGKLNEIEIARRG